MVDRATVWAVRLGTAAPEERGLLAIEGADLVFTPEGGREPTRIPLARVRRVRRALASPVLMVHTETDRGRSITAFYFTEPPPFDPTAVGLARRRARRRAVSSLAAADRVKRQEVKGWVRAIGRAVEAARG